MARLRFTKAEREMIAQLRAKGHSPDAIKREAERCPPTKPGRPKAVEGNEVALWRAVRIKRLRLPTLSVKRASELVAADLENRANDRLSGKRIAALFYEVEARRAVDENYADFTEHTLRSALAALEEHPGALVIPVRMSRS